METTLTNKLKEKKGMIFIPKVLLFKTKNTIDILVYDLMDKIIYFSKDGTGILGFENVAKKFNVTDNDIIQTIGNLEGLGLIKGKILTQSREYLFTINYERLTELQLEYEKRSEIEKGEPYRKLTKEEKIAIINK